MNKEKLKKASIAICKLRELDPYEMVQYSEDARDLVLRKRRRWIEVSEEIQSYFKKEWEMDVARILLDK